MKDAEVIEAMARAMCAADGAIWEAANFNETSDGSDPEDQREYWSDKARAAFKVCAPAIRERCAAVCDVTPLSDACAAAIRALSLPTPHDGLTDTSHHAGSSAGEIEADDEFCANCGDFIENCECDPPLPGPAPSGGEMVLVPRELDRFIASDISEGLELTGLQIQSIWSAAVNAATRNADSENDGLEECGNWSATDPISKHQRETAADHMIAAASLAPPHQGGESE